MATNPISVERVTADKTRQPIRQFTIITTVYLLALAMLAAVTAVSMKTGIPISYFTRDPAAEFNAPMYVGLVSNVGVLIWCSCAAICVFSGLRPGNSFGRWRLSTFLLCSGLFTTLLLLDDLFMLHEEVFPDHLGVPQELVYAGYATVTACYLMCFWKPISTTSYLPLILACGFFAMSIGIDHFVEAEDFSVRLFGSDLAARHLIEDGCKFLGIVSWSTYFVLLAWKHSIECVRMEATTTSES